MAAMLIRAFRLAPILLFTSFVILFAGTFTRHTNASRKVVTEATTQPPISHPDQSHEFYRLKRAPVGQYAVPVERYLAAND
jgi:hypothetical protein